MPPSASLSVQSWHRKVAAVRRSVLTACQDFEAKKDDSLGCYLLVVFLIDRCEPGCAWRLGEHTHTHRHTSTLSPISIVKLAHSVRQGPPTCPPPAPALAPTPAPHSSTERHAFTISCRIGRLCFSWLCARMRSEEEEYD